MKKIIITFALIVAFAFPSMCEIVYVSNGSWGLNMKATHTSIYPLFGSIGYATQNELLLGAGVSLKPLQVSAIYISDGSVGFVLRVDSVMFGVGYTTKERLIVTYGFSF